MSTASYTLVSGGKRNHYSNGKITLQIATPPVDSMDDLDELLDEVEANFHPSTTSKVKSKTISVNG